MSTKTLFSVEEFARRPKDEGIDYELVEGELVQVPSATPRHAMARGKVLTVLMLFLEQHRLGIDRWRRIDKDKILYPAPPTSRLKFSRLRKAPLTCTGRRLSI